MQTVHDLLTDTHQSALDVRVELKAEGDKINSGPADFEARFYAEINSLFRRLEELTGKLDQGNNDLRNLMMTIPYQQNMQSTLDDIAWHSREQYGRSYILDRAAENSGLALDNTRMLGEVSEEVKDVLEGLKNMMEDLLSRLLPPATGGVKPTCRRPSTRQTLPRQQAKAEVQDQVVTLSAGLRFKSPPTAPPTAPAPQVYALPGAPLTLTAEDLGRFLLILQQSQAMMLGR